VNKKTKKKIEVLRKKLDILRRQLAGAKKQTDEPGEVERLSSEVEQVEGALTELKSTSPNGFEEGNPDQRAQRLQGHLSEER
jgi:uncharacterized membrane protein